jgi:hypothetical protein
MIVENGGKAEAVHLGMLHLAKQEQFDYIGFLDADSSTDFEDSHDLVKQFLILNLKWLVVLEWRCMADITEFICNY